MDDRRLATVYTSPGDSWANLVEQTGLTRADLVELNWHVEGLDELSPGIPLNVPKSSEGAFLKQASAFHGAARSAYEVAKEEFLLNIKEDPRPGKDNPRIVLYHSTTSDGAQPDEVAWCSSFVNYCVEQSGKVGTDSKAARSWLHWGESVPRGQWREGDIIVFERGSEPWMGHVGFLKSIQGPRPMVLGGNQGDRLCYDDPYPFSAVLDVRRAT